ncbi:Fic family protein [Paucibacter sp. PLA-PC-4]|uniref:Fic family protein n=1 Tax=Paucibacter sp. PLA-PC-4 TaxID=2993655 RepID=UPI0022492981|nr:Fic family protein [Paucibacter sp. PLA-PC-4]
MAPFREAMLLPSPNIDPGRALRCTQVQALANTMDRKYLAEFIIDFSWGSSVLEGSSYSALDTAALIQYGQQNKSKPTEDALLALNHKRAGEHLWAHRELSVENLRAMHALLTDDHGLPEVGGSDHLLPPEQRGKPRDFEEVSLMNSAYIPPFRPGTGHAAALLDEIISTASGLAPVEAALYLMTRIAYAQSFANGNKRSSRIAANLPLLAAGLIPFSFVDVDKADYTRGMAAFYELGSIHTIEQTFIRGYAKSIVRSSNNPPAMRSRGFDPDQIADLLVAFINTGKPLADARARAFFKGSLPRG